MNIGLAGGAMQSQPEYRKFFQICDVVVAGCRAAQKYISAKWGVPVELIRNGRYNFPNVSFDNLFEKKEILF